jgi:hypothetical protein
MVNLAAPCSNRTLAPITFGVVAIHSGSIAGSENVSRKHARSALTDRVVGALVDPQAAVDASIMSAVRLIVAIIQAWCRMNYYYTC